MKPIKEECYFCGGTNYMWIQRRIGVVGYPVRICLDCDNMSFFMPGDEPYKKTDDVSQLPERLRMRLDS